MGRRASARALGVGVVQREVARDGTVLSDYVGQRHAWHALDQAVVRRGRQHPARAGAGEVPAVLAFAERPRSQPTGVLAAGDCARPLPELIAALQHCWPLW